MMKRLLPALIVLGIVVVLPLVVVGGGAVGLFAAARLGVAPAAELLRVATDGVAAPSVARAEEPAPRRAGSCTRPRSEWSTWQTLAGCAT